MSVVFLITLLMGISQYLHVSENYKAMDLQRRKLVEDNLLNLMKATDSVYLMIETDIEKDSQVVLEKLVETYNHKGLSGVDLYDFYDEKKALDLYVIDASDTVLAATYESDIGLNLSQFEGVGEFLDDIRTEGEFSSDRISLSSLENRVTKYCYLPTPDGKYIFETGRPIDKSIDIPDVLSFGNFGDIISKNQGFVLSALMFSKYGITFNEDVSKQTHIDPKYKEYFDEAIDTLQPVTFEGSFKDQAATITYLPFTLDRAGELHELTVIELIYSNADLQNSKNQMLFILILLSLLGSGVIAAFAVKMSNMLISPLNALHDSITRVSLGDFDSKILLDSNDEFSNIGKHFNGMTDKIKSFMNDLYQKEQELLELYKKEASLNEALVQMMESSKVNYFETIKALANAVEEKDPYTRGHCERVMNYSLSIGNALCLSEMDMEALRFGAILHDIGKIGVPEQILNKETTLTNEEFALIRQHPSIGMRILRDLTFMKDSSKIVLEHHEWFDGNGYPTRTKGDDINFLARIVSVTDAFDAMTSQRPYRKNAMTIPEAIKELKDKSGSQFDPEIVHKFVFMLEQGAHEFSA